jgi:hypothetical protein
MVCLLSWVNKLTGCFLFFRQFEVRRKHACWDHRSASQGQQKDAVGLFFHKGVFAIDNQDLDPRLSQENGMCTWTAEQ